MNHYYGINTYGLPFTSESRVLQRRVASTFVGRVYRHLAGALVVIAAVACLLGFDPDVCMALWSSSYFSWAVIIASIAGGALFQLVLPRMSKRVALWCFYSYGACLGICFSPFVAVFTLKAIACCFGLTSAMLGGMALYGQRTKADLTRFGAVFSMACVGLAATGVLNWVVGSPGFAHVLSFAVIIVLAGLTAYYMKEIKSAAAKVLHDPTAETKLALSWAIILIMVFLNVFARLLRLAGRLRS